jgi:hypothetical protein
MSEPRSTTAQGNAFRDSVKRILELTPGCTNVQPELLIGTQPVDLYYEERTSFRMMKVACECKDYGRPLTKDFIASNIFPRYSPLLNNKQVDAVRIIAPLELGATASAYVKECGFSFHTIDQLESEIIDFRQYLRTMQSGFTEDGLDQYYVRPQLADGSDLEVRIDEWLVGDSRQPVAILAGYGMGKTSFARRLAHRLARAALVDPRARIPIFIPLSEISSEQTLEGLLGKLLAAQHRIPGYHFSMFTELNRRGRLVLILDGFDEMKHTMAWSEFKHNFGELNRLCNGNSRVVLLGRPSALLSEDEELYVLRGKRRAGDQVFTVPGAPDYLELRLAQFSAEQALAFMRRYASYRMQAQAAFRGATTETFDVNGRIEGLRENPDMMALVLRPVQAKMLADLAIDPEVTWRSFNRYELFREFISRITEREARKPTRSVFIQQVRESFIRKVAWWMWTHSSSGGFHIDELPLSTISPFPSGVASGPEGVRRDLVSGSVLEKKAGDRYYFPHRSFMEFLVAEFICLEGPIELDEIGLALSSEIVSFIKDSGHAPRIVQMAEEINEIEYSVASTLLELIAWARNKVGMAIPASAASDATPRDVLIDSYRMRERQAPFSDVANFLSHAFVETTDVQTRLVSLFALLHLDELTQGGLRTAVRNRVVTFILVECLAEIKRVNDFGRARSVAVENRDPFVHILANTLTGRLTAPSGRIEITANMTDVREAIEDCILPKWQPGGPTELVEVSEIVHFALSDLAAMDKRLALSAEGGAVMTFFKRFPDPSKLIPISGKRHLRQRRRNES